MLRAGEFEDVIALREQDLDLIEALSRDQEYGATFPTDVIERLLEIGLIQQSPFRGYALTVRGQLIATRERMRQNRSNTFLGGLRRLGLPGARRLSGL